jgi:formate dehydrogenase assembly factor FdhD
VDLAETTGIALCGFVRDGRCNVYANGWRLGLAERP